MQSYLIFCCPGTGGLFLTSVLAKLLGIDIKSKFSNTGDAHDMGQGIWKGHPSICFIGNHWGQNYKKNIPIYYSHVLPDTFLKDNRNIQTIFIHADQTDFKKITEMYVKKAWPSIWTKEEYNKWASTDYPPYSPDNIKNSNIIQNDLINDFESTVVQKWYQQNLYNPLYKKVNFRTIMGIDSLDLLNVMSSIVQLPKNQEIQQYVLEYQTLNQKLYFTE